MIPIAKPIISEKEQALVLEVMKTGQLASGSYVEKFEELFAKYLGCKYAIATNSGTAALHASLLAAGIGRGDLVITTPFSFIATSNSILYVGAIPLFVDVEEDSYNIDPDKIEELIINTKEKIKAILIVHLFGNPCTMDKILDICNKYNIILIEDCAQAHGAEYKNKKVGTFGAAGAFSFYPTKNMTTGEGGMVTTNNEKIYKEVKKIINHGMVERYYHEDLGFNFRLTNLGAAIGIEQLKELETFISRRIANANKYNNGLSEEKFLLPPIKANTRHVFNQFTLRCKGDRNKVIEILQKNGIGYGIYYPLIIPEQPFYKKLQLNYHCPIGEKLSKDVLSIPVHPSLSSEDIEIVIKSLNSLG
jgi:dTDP-4-amino-4,6-dideoxygalactose transaminase